MYKCKECGAEYKEKPDYCECGNDEFEFLVPESEPIKAEDVPKEPEPVVVQQVKSNNQGFISNNKAKQEQRYSPFDSIKKAVDPVSGAIFLLCLILSFYVIFFAWNPKETVVAETPAKEAIVNKNIPSIDKFWNNTPPVVKVEPKKEEPKIVEEVKKIIQPVINTEPKKVTPVQKTVQKKNTTPKTTTVKLNKTTTQPKQTTVKKTVQQTKTTQPIKTETKPVTQQTPVTVPQKTDAQNAAEKAAVAQKAAQEKQELVNYKAKLRNTIGRKIDFTRVVGDGGCSLAFKVDSTGRLVNRSFTQQSSNITLNDAVYAAMMSTPVYNPPPSGYKGETLNLTIRFYNGNYEITLR